MKNRLLDVDFIGGDNPLTKEEETMISDFIRSRKSITFNNPKNITKKRLTFA